MCQVILIRDSTIQFFITLQNDSLFKVKITIISLRKCAWIICKIKKKLESMHILKKNWNSVVQ